MRLELDVIGEPNFRGYRDYDPARALDQIGLSFLALIRSSFRAGVDPFGNAWEPLKVRRGQPLLDTGRLLKSIGYTVTGSTLTVGTNLIYAETHNKGLGRVPRRQFVPDSNNPPTAWLNVAAAAFNKDIQKHVTRTTGRAV